MVTIGAQTPTAIGQRSGHHLDVKISRYRPRISDRWIEVPDYAKLDDANIVGRAIVWIWSDQTVGIDTVLRIRCFLPGAEL
jgi:hypothetical protein